MRALLLLCACVFTACPLDTSITWACEADGSCPDGLVCVDDRCVAPPAAGGGAAGGSSAAGGAAGGAACVPARCPQSAECGYVDGGCGAEVFCGGCSAPQECGVFRANRCDEPNVCTPEGWCWEHPLPQGSDITGLFALGPRAVYLSTTGGTVLFWNGEHTSGTSFPTRAGVALRAIHGSAANDVYVVGTNRIFHLEGTTWTSETVPPSVTGGLSAVFATGEGAWAGGRDGVVLSRGPGANWSQLVLSPPSTNEVVALEVVGSTLLAVLSDGSVYVTLVGNRQLNRVTAGPGFQEVNASVLAFDGGVVMAVGHSGGRTTRVASFEFTQPDAGWNEQLTLSIDQTPRAAAVLDDQLVIAGGTGIVFSMPLASSGTTPVPFANAVRGFQAAVTTSADEVLLGGSGGQFASVRRAAGGFSYRDNMPVRPASDTLNDGCAIGFGLDPRVVVTTSANRFAERIAGRWSFGSGPAATSAYDWTKCHFVNENEAWAVGFKPDAGSGVGFYARVANRRWPATEWADIDTGFASERWTWVTGFPGGPTYFLTEPFPTGQPVIVNLDGGLSQQSFVRYTLDGGLAALAAINRRASFPLHGVGDRRAYVASSDFSALQRTMTVNELTAVTGVATDGGSWSIAGGRGGLVYERPAGGVPIATVNGTDDFIDVWAAQTFDAYFLANGVASPGVPRPYVFVRSADGGLLFEQLPLQRARGLFGVDTATGHQVWVTGPNGSILRRDSR